ncbi:Carbon-nitrogen hydrolase [Xylographa opegraphella]|nr:Carbon-nitrogen hydrolase [Xylographa opegraphella]
MHIATLQFSPVLGQVAHNMARADELLAAADTAGLDLLVLPELAFTGYNFSSLAAITPHLEPTARGPSAQWALRTARRLQCVVCVGYPERATSPTAISISTPQAPSSPPHFPPTAIPPPSPLTPPNHNALLLASPTGLILAHYRKTHLYYTDSTWAHPSREGFQTVDLPLPFPLSSFTTTTTTTIPTALGICMDLNPSRFLAPWRAFEFATHARARACALVLLSMAWLAQPQPARGGGDLDASSHAPDADTQAYWVARLEPLVRGAGEAVVVCANRCGVEGQGETEVRYAGSSAVLCVGRGRARVGGCLGRGEEGLLRVDTEKKGVWKAGWVLAGREEEEGGEE